MDIKKVMNWRHSTKAYDPDKKISSEDFDALKAALRLAPSSSNLQPWHFIIAKTDEGKDRFINATKENHSFNSPKIKNCSHVVAFCAKTNYDEDYFRKITEKEDEDGRFAKEKFKENGHKGRVDYVNFHKYYLKDVQHWAEKQVYLNMGCFLLAVASLGIDATPMEGFDRKAFDKEFGLREKGYTALALVAMGYHSSDDFNADLPKSRFEEETIMTIF